MSNLRNRLEKMAGPNQAWIDMQEEQRDNMQLSDSPACKDYPDPKYKNQKGMVSPLNIMVMDHINSIYNMSVDEAAQFVIDNMDGINQRYAGDPFYDTFSQAKLKEMYYKMVNMKPKTIDKVVEYLTNAMYKGMTRLTDNRSKSIKTADNEAIEEAAKNTEKVMRQKGLSTRADIAVDKQKYIDLVTKVRDSMQALSTAWEQKDDTEFEEIDAFLSHKYPFQNSFDEVCASVNEWLESLKNR